MTIAFLYGHAFDVGWGLATALIGAVLGVVIQALIGRGRDPETLIRQTTINQTVNMSGAPQTMRTRSRRRRKAIFNQDEKIVLGVVIAFGVVGFYLRWRYDISVGLAISALVVVGLSLGIGLYTALRLGLRHFPIGLVLPAVGVAIFAFVDGRALNRPAFSHGRYAVLLHSFDHGGLTHMTDRFGFEGVLFVLYQALGVFLPGYS
jgi:hypothetical protein